MVFNKTSPCESWSAVYAVRAVGPGTAWALWKALITHAGNLEINPVAAAKARRVIDDVLAEHEHRGDHCP